MRRWLLLSVLTGAALLAVTRGLLHGRERAAAHRLPRQELTVDGQRERYARLLAAGGAPAEAEVLGNPAARYYPRCDQSNARNPWDLAVLGDRIYVGIGDAGEEGPSPNAGPVPALAYDLRASRFVQETTLDDEQVNRFYVRDGELWVPGDDPRANWALGNVYLRDHAGTWTELRTIPRAIHAHALLLDGERMLVGLTVTDSVPTGTVEEAWGSAVGISRDGGRSWRVQPLGGMRIFEFLRARGRIVATDMLPGPGVEQWLARRGRTGIAASAYEERPDGTFQRREDLTQEALLPETPLAGRRAAQLERAVPWREGTAYVAAFRERPGGTPVRLAYLALSLDPGGLDVRRIPLPPEARAMDLLVEDGSLWVLHATPLEGGRFRNGLWRSDDGLSWREAIPAFEAPAAARSAVLHDGSAYLGLGVLHPPERGACAPSDELSGTILRLPLAR